MTEDARARRVHGLRPRPAGGRPQAALIACLAALFLAGAAAAQPRETWKGQPDYVTALALSPDGKTLASFSLGGGTGGIKLWDLAAEKEKALLCSEQRTAGCLAFTPDGKALVAVGQRWPKEGEQEKDFSLWSAKVWDVAAQKVRLTVDLPEGGACGCLLTHDGKSLIAGGPKTPVVLYDLGTGKPSEPLDLGKAYRDACSMVLSPDGKTLAVAMRSGGIVLWDLEKKAVRATVPADGTYCAEVLAFSPDGKTLASSGGWAGGLVWLLDAATGKSASTLDVGPRISGVKVLAFSPDGKTLAVGGGRWGVALWDLAAGGERDDFEGDLHTASVECAVFTPDGKTLITGGIDKGKAIWFWDVPQGKPKCVKPIKQLTPAEADQLQKVMKETEAKPPAPPPGP